MITSQIKQWSILSSVVNYVQYDRTPRDFYNKDKIKVIDQIYHRKIYGRLEEEEEDRQVVILDLAILQIN